MLMIKSYAIGLCLLCYSMSEAQDSIPLKEKWFTLHAQETTVSQFRPAFHAAYTGEHSQTPEQQWATTLTSTLFTGLRLWPHAQVIFNPEIAGGSGLSSAFGVAAFTNGEAFRVGSPEPKIYVARAFFQQIFPLGKARVLQEDDANKIQKYIPETYISFTAGKVSIADFFDNNAFSHDPRTQFLSWGLMSNGAWDYPANTRGYTPSAILELVGKRWEVRYAISMMPVTANGNVMDQHISKANANTLELKYKYSLAGRDGKLSVLGFYNTAFMGSYTAPNIISTPDSANPNFIVNDYDISASRQYGRSKYGLGINLEQTLTDNVGLFARASWNDGKNETWCFTEIDRAFSIGTSIKGNRWKRGDDVLGFAYCISGLSNEHAAYLSKGGLGFIIGDGALNYRPENLLETYYSLNLLKGRLIPSFSYQFVINPAYNADRGPIHVLSLRVHLRI